MKQLISDLKADTTHASLKKPLINQFSKLDLIPNKWFDWERRQNARVMIIGQDWGPYVALKKYVDDYEAEKNQPEFNYDRFLFKRFSSRTEKFIFKAVESTYLEKFGEMMPQETWDDFFFTMAVLFTRTGKHFRGSHNFDNESSRRHSLPYLRQQIEIVQPQVIMTLGGLALQSVSEIFDFELANNLAQTLANLGPEGTIKVGKTVIIPNYHPAAFVNPKIMLERWRKLWDYFGGGE